MKFHLVTAISVLTLGTALASVSSFAQVHGGPAAQQQSTGTVPQQQPSHCIRFQLGCSDQPYPMASAATNSVRTNARVGRERTRISERERLGRRRVASNHAGARGETYGGRQAHYYNSTAGRWN